MARTPRASVSTTSGQSITRGSYQKGYALAKSADAPTVKAKFSSQTPRDYTKSTAVTSNSAPMNVSYGSTYDPTDLKDVQSSFTAAPSKPFNTTPKPSKVLK